MKIVELLDESIQVIGDYKIVLNNVGWTYDIYKSDEIVKSFKFDDADDKPRAKKDAYAYVGKHNKG